MPMKAQFIILMFVSTNLFGIKDTTRFKFIERESSRILNAIDTHLKYDEFYAIEYYMADTLHLAVDKKLYECSPSYAIEVLQRTRAVIKNNNYKYQLKTKDEDDGTSIHDYIYYGYNKHIIKGGYTVYDRYQVTLEFTEYKKKIIFIAIILSIVEDED